MENEEWLRRIPETKCLKCNYTLDAIAEGKDICSVPEEDDLVLCFKCYTPMLFNKDLSLRLLNVYERNALDSIIEETTRQIEFLKRG